MINFGWKRKIGDSISKDKSQKFSLDVSSAENESEHAPIEVFKRKRKDSNQDKQSKSMELRRKGEMLAEQNRYQDAIHQFDLALNLYPDEKTLEMKAQALLELDEPYLAVCAAEKAVKINPQWWVAYQTLGRSQLGIGDLEMAKRSFSKAIFLNPGNNELWEEDLNYTLELMKQKVKLQEELAENGESLSVNENDNLHPTS